MSKLVTFAKDLSESQKDAFWAAFPYNYDQESSLPWGMPWLCNGYQELYGNTVEEMAENYWKEVEVLIKGLFLEHISQCEDDSAEQDSLVGIAESFGWWSTQIVC